MGRLSSETDEAGLAEQDEVLEAHAQFSSYLHHGSFSSAEKGSILQPMWNVLAGAKVLRMQK